MYNKTDFEMPSRRQLAAAARYGINVTSEMDAQDVSDLLSRHLRQDPKEPNPGLIEFARNRGIHFANGIGKRHFTIGYGNSYPGMINLPFSVSVFIGICQMTGTLQIWISLHTRRVFISLPIDV